MELPNPISPDEQAIFTFDIGNVQAQPITSQLPKMQPAPSGTSFGNIKANRLSPKAQQAAQASRNRRKRSPALARLTLRGRSLSVTHNVSKITEQLYLGGSDVSSNLPQLQKLQISHICNCTTKLASHFEDQIKYYRTPVSDDPESQLDQFFEASSDFIEEAVRAGGVVLVHCSAGMSRSGTIVLAYMMRHGISHHARQLHRNTPRLKSDAGQEAEAVKAEGGTSSDSGVALIDALHYVKERRPVVSPNQGFITQLAALEVELRGGESTIDVARYESMGRFSDVSSFAVRPPQPVPLRIAS